MLQLLVRGSIVALLAFGGAACSLSADAARDEDGTITESAEVDAFNVRPGDCFDMPDGLLIESVAAVPCTEPHDSQAFRAFDITGFESLPSETEIEDLVIEGCLGAHFEDFVGVPYELSALSVTWLEPTEETWDRVDDREILCIITNEAAMLTSDARNSSV